MSNPLDENLIGAGLDSHLSFRWEHVSGDGSRASFTGAANIIFVGQNFLGAVAGAAAVAML